MHVANPGRAIVIALHHPGIAAASGGGDIDPSKISAYKPNMTYQDGDQVKNRGAVYRCKPFPNSGWCGQAPSAYEPGVGFAWNDAWNKVGDVPKQSKSK